MSALASVAKALRSVSLRDAALASAQAAGRKTDRQTDRRDRPDQTRTKPTEPPPPKPPHEPRDERTDTVLASGLLAPNLKAYLPGQKDGLQKCACGLF